MANYDVYIEQAIHNIEAERDQQLANVKATIMQEKVAPQNAEIDQKRDLALQELQEEYTTKRQEIIDASEKQKTENANEIINTETASIVYEYNAKIAELRKIIGG